MTQTIERTRLCLTIPLGSSVRIGDCDVFVAAIVSKPGMRGNRYNEAMLRNSTGNELWYAEGTEAYFTQYSLLVTEITTTKVRMAIHADKSVTIARAGVEPKDLHNCHRNADDNDKGDVA